MARNFPPRPQRGAPQQGAPQQGASTEGPSTEGVSKAGISSGAVEQPSLAKSTPALNPYAPGGTFNAPQVAPSDPSLAEWPVAGAPQPYEVLPGLYQRPIENVLAAEERETPSLPIILVSAAVGMVAGVSTYFILQQLLNVRLDWAVAAAVLALCFGLGGTGAILSAATGSRAAVPNILFSCGVILLAGLFLGLCMVVGALGATLSLFLQG